MHNSNEIESVWTYPRPPRLERTHAHIRVVHRGVVLADTTAAWRVLETSHPPVFYLPPGDIAGEWLRLAGGRESFCEFKGLARYWTVDLRSAPGVPAEDAVAPRAAWSYAAPARGYEALRDHLAFYASRVDACTVDGERVAAQPGDFYGGWITSRVKGPFKGAPGTQGW